ncbi:MAG: sensor histidine kinase [Spirosomataceae bacterium]
MPKVRLILRNLAEFYEYQENYKMANEYRKKWAIYNDSFTQKQNHTRIQLNEAHFRSIQKQEKINELQQQQQLQELQIKRKNALMTALIISVIALSMLAFLYYKNYKKEKLLSTQNHQIQQQKIRELEQEKQLISMNSLLKGQEEERSRMAKDLHDGLGSMLSGIKLNLSAMHQHFIVHLNEAQLFEKALTQLDSAIAEMRRVAHNMMPEALLKFGLHEAIQDYCDSINQNSLLRMQFTAICDGKTLDTTIQKVLYRIFQELTTNAIKHAEAKTIFIQINHHDRGITLTVEDDGKGFDAANKEGAGLKNVKSRVDYLQGSLEIDSTLGSGTSITVEIPNQV